MISILGSEKVKEMKEKVAATKKKANKENEKKETFLFIIPPGNYWNMQWNNFTILISFVYIILTPTLIGSATKLASSHSAILLIFDIIFMLDRILDLFVSDYNPDGTLETNVAKVVY